MLYCLAIGILLTAVLLLLSSIFFLFFTSLVPMIGSGFAIAATTFLAVIVWAFVYLMHTFQ